MQEAVTFTTDYILQSPIFYRLPDSQGATRVSFRHIEVNIEETRFVVYYQIEGIYSLLHRIAKVREETAAASMEEKLALAIETVASNQCMVPCTKYTFLLKDATRCDIFSHYAL